MGSFDSLKREAVQLERQLEDKVGRYQQLAHKSAAASSSVDAGDVLSRAEQGLDHTNLAAHQSEIALVLQQLHDLVKKMEPSAVTPSQRAVCKRCRDIHHDLHADFDKATRVVQRARDRHELLGGGNAAAPDSANGRDAAMDSLLRERNHISNSMNAAANVIGQAESVRQDLHWQGQSLRNTNSVMGVIATNIPGVNALVSAIQSRRSKDDKIVAVVIATCIVFTLWYVLG